MTSSEMMKNQQNITTESLKKVERLPSSGILLPLRVLEYLCLAAAIGLSITALVFPVRLIVAVAIAVGLFIFLRLVNSKLEKSYTKKAKELKIKKKAILCNSCVSETQ